MWRANLPAEHTSGGRDIIYRDRDAGNVMAGKANGCNAKKGTVNGTPY